VLVAMNQLGFSLNEVECEKSRDLGGSFVQEFEFNAIGGEFKRRVDEVEMLMVNHDDHLALLVEVDRKARGLGGFFSEMLGTDETKLWVQIYDDNLDQVTDVIHTAIDDHC